MEIEVYGMLVQGDKAFLRQTESGLSLIGGPANWIEPDIKIDLDQFLFDLALRKITRYFKRIGIDIRGIDRRFAIPPSIFEDTILLGYAIPTVLINGKIDLKKSGLTSLPIDDLISGQLNDQLVKEGYLGELIHLIAHKYKIS